MPRNYYVVLGVPFDAARGTIRAAFRRLALRYHPDRGAEADSRLFQEAAEAYNVLSDPQRRARYDRRLDRSPRPSSASIRNRVRHPEPLISEPVTVTGHPDTVRPSYEALIERFARNFAGFEAPRTEKLEPLNFELILTRDEAERGVRVPFRIPVFTLCRQCGGSGRHRLFLCSRCDGRGRQAGHAAVEVRVPRHVRDHARMDVSLEDLGIRNLWLRVHIRVGP